MNNNVLSDQNHTNNNNATIFSFSLSAAADAVTYPLLQNKYSTYLGTDW